MLDQQSPNYVHSTTSPFAHFINENIAKLNMVSDHCTILDPLQYYFTLDEELYFQIAMCDTQKEVALLKVLYPKE
jgi:hypothetical protein